MNSPKSSIWPEGYGAGPGSGVSFYCQKCGAVVMNIRTHTAWHDRVEPAKPATVWREWMQAHCMCATPDWYHDGGESDVEGRLCRRCRKRQNIPYRDLIRQVSWDSVAEIPGDVDAVLDCEGDSWRRDKYDPNQEGIPRTWEWYDKHTSRWSYSAGMHRFAPFVAGGEGA